MYIDANDTFVICNFIYIKVMQSTVSTFISIIMQTIIIMNLLMVK